MTMKSFDIPPSHLVIGLLCALLFSSCVDRSEFDLELDPDPPLMINALITDQAGPYYVQVSKAVSNFSGQDEYAFGGLHIGESFNPITDATVILSDDQGNSDVLELCTQSFAPKSSWGDTLKLNQYGFYKTSTNLRGVPGRTYTLTVQYDGNTYEAKTTMPNAPPTPTISYDQYIYPLLNFNEPQDEENYYMFFYREVFDNDSISSPAFAYNYPDNLWPFFYTSIQIRSDQFWGSEVSNLDIHENNLIKGTQIKFCFECAENMLIQMHSITKEVYDFYSSLKQQARNDGGTFTTEPATPPSSFTNGVLGIFRASAVQSITAPIKY
ncbi:hypothetical protein BKI52_03845 [marine bacterium AO1-C]|nr:hypothetical protein BKI52_03845 [marine bacterium AO1-C]